MTAFGELLGEPVFFPEISLYSAAGVRDGLLLNPVFHEKKQILSAEENGKTISLRLEGVDSVDDAEPLKGLYLGISLSHACDLARENFEEIFLFEYIGANVSAADTKPSQETSGTIERIETVAGEPILYIRFPGGVVPIPLNADYVQKFDRETKSLKVDHLSEYILAYLGTPSDKIL